MTFLELSKNDSLNETYKESQNKQGGFKERKLFDFDPNEIGLNKWMQLGFSEKQSHSILAYRDKFGPFKNKEQLKKLYVVSEANYKSIEKHIKIDGDKLSSNQADKPSTYPDKTVNHGPVELNSCTLEEITSIRGIGDYYGNKLLLLREKTGGFITFEQLETARFAPLDILNVLEENTTIDPALIIKKNVNTISKQELKRIPFMNWSAVAAILKERETNQLKDLDFLKENFIDEVSKEKLLYYLKFE